MHDHINIFGLFVDGFLSSFRDVNLESVDSVSKFLDLEVSGANDTKEKGKSEFHSESGLFLIKNIFDSRTLR